MKTKYGEGSPYLINGEPSNVESIEEVVCYEGWTGPDCQTPEGHPEMMSILWANTNTPLLPPDYSFMLYLEIIFTE